ncbi:MAG: EVE domain-containing protein, partial [Pseudomonadota bacterium]
LQQIKDTPELAEMALVKQMRLSVQPVTPEEWERVCLMGGFKKADIPSCSAP